MRVWIISISFIWKPGFYWIFKGYWYANINHIILSSQCKYYGTDEPHLKKTSYTQHRYYLNWQKCNKQTDKSTPRVLMLVVLLLCFKFPQAMCYLALKCFTAWLLYYVAVFCLLQQCFYSIVITAVFLQQYITAVYYVVLLHYWSTALLLYYVVVIYSSVVQQCITAL